MLSVFRTGVFLASVLVVCTALQAVAEGSCFQDLVDGKTRLKGANIVECGLKTQNSQNQVISDLRTALGEKMASGDQATLAEAKKQLQELSILNPNIALSKEFNERALVAQIQAQATCSAIAFSQQNHSKYVRTVLRPYLTSNGTVASGSGDVATCNEICSAVPPVNSSVGNGVCFAALHIYSDHDPVLPIDTDFTRVGERNLFTRKAEAGLMTYVYETANGCGHKHFGPNVCCCKH